MYHSISFYDGTSRFNTYSTWGLVPETRPHVVPPEPKTKYLDIPAGNGRIDLTESLTGYPVYNDREGEWVFYVLNDYIASDDPPGGIWIVDTLDEHGGTIRSISTRSPSPDPSPDGTPTYTNWADRLSAIMNAVQGKKIKAVLDDDDGYYYEGRFYVSDWDSSGETYSTITFSYIVDPYKKGCTIGRTGDAVYLVDTGVSKL